MNEEKFNQSINHALNKSLEDIDEKTKNELASIRHHALQSIQQETASDVNRNTESDVIILSAHPLWRNKKIRSIVLALAASLLLVVIMPGIVQKNSVQDFSSDFAFYSEVDPDWLSDMEMLEVLGDD